MSVACSGTTRHTQYKQVAFIAHTLRTYQPVWVTDYRMHPSTKATILSHIGKKKHFSCVTNSTKNLVFSYIILAQAQEFRSFRFETFCCGAHVRRLQVCLL
jgi:hypothetical protein